MVRRCRAGLVSLAGHLGRVEFLQWHRLASKLGATAHTSRPCTMQNAASGRSVRNRIAYYMGGFCLLSMESTAGAVSGSSKPATRSMAEQPPPTIIHSQIWLQYHGEGMTWIEKRRYLPHGAVGAKLPYFYARVSRFSQHTCEITYRMVGLMQRQVCAAGFAGRWTGSRSKP